MRIVKLRKSNTEKLGRQMLLIHNRCEEMGNKLGARENISARAHEL